MYNNPEQQMCQELISIFILFSQFSTLKSPSLEKFLQDELLLCLISKGLIALSKQDLEFQCI